MLCQKPKSKSSITIEIFLFVACRQRSGGGRPYDGELIEMCFKINERICSTSNGNIH